MQGRECEGNSVFLISPPANGDPSRSCVEGLVGFKGLGLAVRVQGFRFQVIQSF